MLRAMFGMGGTEILVILIVALLFLGPDKLPEAAKQISKGIRDIKKQSRVLQQTIEDDEHIGGAIRDLRSALRGEEPPVRPKPPKQLDVPTPDAAPAIGSVAAAIVGAPGDAGADAERKADDDAATAAAAFAPGPTASEAATGSETPIAEAADTTGASFEGAPSHMATAPASNGLHAEAPKLTLPPTAGESEGEPASDAEELAALVKPAPNTIARGAGPSGSGSSEPSHG
jgi:sec-independent protein translocase protein TatB